MVLINSVNKSLMTCVSASYLRSILNIDWDNECIFTMDTFYYNELFVVLKHVWLLDEDLAK